MRMLTEITKEEFLALSGVLAKCGETLHTVSYLKKSDEGMYPWDFLPIIYIEDKGGDKFYKSTPANKEPK